MIAYVIHPLFLFLQRLSEICCFAVTQLLMLGKSIISNANKLQDEEIEEETMKIDWPEDSVERAKILRTKAQSMTENMEAICNGFITGKFSFNFLTLVYGHFIKIKAMQFHLLNGSLWLQMTLP